MLNYEAIQPTNEVPGKAPLPDKVIVDHNGVTHTLSAVTDWRGRNLAVLRYTDIKEQVRTGRYN